MVQPRARQPSWIYLAINSIHQHQFSATMRFSTSMNKEDVSPYDISNEFMIPMHHDYIDSARWDPLQRQIRLENGYTTAYRRSTVHERNWTSAAGASSKDQAGIEYKYRLEGSSSRDLYQQLSRLTWSTLHSASGQPWMGRRRRSFAATTRYQYGYLPVLQLV